MEGIVAMKYSKFQFILNRFIFKILASLIFSIGILFTFGADAKPQIQQNQVTGFMSERPKMRQDYWQKRQNSITEMLTKTRSLSDIKLVFLGDSITDFWLLDENPWFPGKYCGLSVWNGTFSNGPARYKAINLGISGDRTEHILYRLSPKQQGGLGELDRRDLNPEFIIILAGINNSYEAENPKAESIIAGVKAILRRAHNAKPDAIIILQSLLPTAETERNETVVAPVNAILSGIEGDPEFSQYVKFLDLHKVFVDQNGNQQASYFNDGLHPSRNGYEVWKSTLVAKIDSLRNK